MSSNKISAYTEVKDSGFEWDHEVPYSWRVARFKHAIDLIESGKRDSVDYSEILSIGGEHIGSNGRLRLENLRFVSEEFYSSSKKGRVCGNDILVVKDGATIGKTAFVETLENRRMLLNEHVYRIVSNKFYYYFILSSFFQAQIWSKNTSSAQEGLNLSTINNIPALIPSKEEQTQIAKFLDYETAKIDGLIEKQQQLIELLQEKRQAVISHAVTKGLNPDAPMRDSGVEWLGKVPAHWDVKKLRYFAQILRGKFTHRPRNDPAFYDGEFPFVQTGDITGASKYITGYRQTLNARGASVSKEFPKGTLVMAIAANIGDVAILDFSAYFPDSVVGLLPNNTADVMFMYYMMQAMKQPMLQRATISTQMNLNIDQISWLTSACPPVEEQREIAKVLDTKLSRMDGLHEKMTEIILYLQERRTALISAAVTGKIDVRKWKLPTEYPETNFSEELQMVAETGLEWNNE